MGDFLQEKKRGVQGQKERCLALAESWKPWVEGTGSLGSMLLVRDTPFLAHYSCFWVQTLSSPEGVPLC